MNFNKLYDQVRADAARVGWAWISLGMVLALWNLWRQQRFFHDDAYISLRYAYNLIHHGEPTWNLGEWVEGFTSILHLLLLSLVGSMNIPLPDAARLVNFAAYAVVLVLGWQLARRLGEGRFGVKALSFFVLAASAPLAIWAWGALEAVLACAWVSAACVLLVAAWPKEEGPARPALIVLAGMCLALAVATRPDMLSLTLGCAAGLGLSQWRQSWRRALLLASALALPAVLTQVGLLALRWDTYHLMAPNTYYAKVHGVPVWHRLQTGISYLLRSSTEMPMLPAVALVLAWNWRLLGHSLFLTLSAGLATFVAGICWVGGDHMIAARFLVPILPMLVILVAALFMQEGLKSPSQGALLAGLLLTALSPLLRPSMPINPAAWMGQLVGQHMHQHWPKGSLVALNTAGAPAYYAMDLRYIDMLGLNDAHIAQRVLQQVSGSMQLLPGHAKGDGAYVLQREPDFIIAGFAEGQPVEKSEFFGDGELAQMPAFHQCYKLETARIAYDPAFGKLGIGAPNPVTFTYYRRTCRKSTATG